MLSNGDVKESVVEFDVCIGLDIKVFKWWILLVDFGGLGIDFWVLRWFELEGFGGLGIDFRVWRWFELVDFGGLGVENWENNEFELDFWGWRWLWLGSWVEVLGWVGFVWLLYVYFWDLNIVFLGVWFWGGLFWVFWVFGGWGSGWWLFLLFEFEYVLVICLNVLCLVFDNCELKKGNGNVFWGS